MNWQRKNRLFSPTLLCEYSIKFANNVTSLMMSVCCKIVKLRREKDWLFVVTDNLIKEKKRDKTIPKMGSCLITALSHRMNIHIDQIHRNLNAQRHSMFLSSHFSYLTLGNSRIANFILRPSKSYNLLSCLLATLCIFLNRFRIPSGSLFFYRFLVYYNNFHRKPVLS